MKKLLALLLLTSLVACSDGNDGDKDGDGNPAPQFDFVTTFDAVKGEWVSGCEVIEGSAQKVKLNLINESSSEHHTRFYPANNCTTAPIMAVDASLSTRFRHGEIELLETPNTVIVSVFDLATRDALNAQNFCGGNLSMGKNTVLVANCGDALDFSQRTMSIEISNDGSRLQFDDMVLRRP